MPKHLITVACFAKKHIFRVSVKVSILQAEKEKTSVDILKSSTSEPRSDDPIIKKVETKCNFCDKCPDCVKLDEKEEKKKSEKEELDSNVAALNYLAFSLLLLFIFVLNMAIWISIGS